MNDLESTFKKLKNEFDNAEPKIGHFDRFQSKLKGHHTTKNKTNNVRWYWLSAAASILLLFGFWLGNENSESNIDIAKISPKMEETQSFYLTVIQKEIELIQNERTPENNQIIDDAFIQLAKLEKNHKKLSEELIESNEDKRVIYAMIANFQLQIEVLQNLVDQLEEFKNLNEFIQVENRV